MLTHGAWDSRPPQSYSSYKNERFKIYMDKATAMSNNVEALSLKKEDKIKLLEKIKERIETSIRNVKG